VFQKRYSLAATEADRPVVAPPWLITALFVMAAVILILLYPMQELERRLADTADSKLASSYLDNLLRSAPENPRLRMLLARSQIRLGETEKARDILRPALESADDELRREAWWTLWEMYRTEARRLQKLSPAIDRDTLLVRLRDEQLAAAGALVDLLINPERIIEVARTAYALDEPRLSQVLFDRLASVLGRGEAAVRFYEAASATALAHGDYRGASTIFMHARQAADDPLAARRLFHQAVRILQSGNLLAEALALAETQMGAYRDDHETLIMMVNLARSAGRPEVADRYVRLLLRLSLLRAVHLVQMAWAWGPGQWLPVGTQAAAPTGQPQLPFDESIYELGYTVFMENRKLDDAWQVARSAVAHSADKPRWRQRLAQLAEWRDQPREALSQWQQLAEETGDEAAWQSVLRLAPGLFDDPALIAGLQHELAARPGDPGLLPQIVDAYKRLAQPQAAIDFLAREYRRRPDPALLAWQADIAEGAGQLALAEALWRQLFADPAEATPARVLQAAVFMLSQGRGEEALPWLATAAAQAGTTSKTDIDYWRLSGQAALMFRNLPMAMAAYSRLLETPAVGAGDYDVLISLLGDEPQTAARLAEQAWQRLAQPKYLMQALTYHALRNDFAEVGRLLAALDQQPEAKRPFLNDPEFLRIVGLRHQVEGRLPQARRVYEEGLRRLPNASALRQALLWLLIDTRDAAGLRQLLRGHEALWQRDEAMHDALAAAYQILSQPQTAIDRYLTPRLAAHEGDFLWLMAYADALEQNQQADRAWGLRRFLLARERSAAVADDPLQVDRRAWVQAAGEDAARRLARTRLLMTQVRGDAALASLRELLRLDRQASAVLDDGLAELTLGWLQEGGQYAAERGFLWQHYVQSRQAPDKKPLWAEISLALVEEDGEAARDLLERAADFLPRYDAVTAAGRVGDLRLAQSLAFDLQQAQHDDTPLHTQLRESLLAFSDYGQGQWGGSALGSIDLQQWGGTAHLAVNPRLALDFELRQLTHTVRDTAVLASAPAETRAGLRLIWQNSLGEGQAYIGQRQALRDTLPLEISQSLRVDRHLALRFEAGFHLPSEETLAMRLGGMKDRLAVTLRHQLTARDQWTLGVADEHYALQAGASLGRGRRLALEFSHLLLAEAPQLEAGAFWSQQRYDRQTDFSSPDFASLQPLLPTTIAGPTALPANYFLPDDYTLTGLRLSSNMRYEREYTRALRPFGSLARTWHSLNGVGYDLRLGLAGSLLGGDHLGLVWGTAKSGAQSAGLIRNWNLRYRLHF